MGTTPNLSLPLIAANQNQKEVTANATFDGLDEALCSYLAVAMTDADYTFATGQFAPALSNMVFIFTGTLTANRHVIFPPNSKPYIVVNKTTGGHSLIFEVGSNMNTVTISDSVHHLLHCDGVNSVYAVDGTVAGDLPPRNDAITGFLPGTYSSNEVIFQIPVAFAYTFPANFTGSDAYCVTPPTANAVFQILHNGVEIGTITFDASPLTHVGIFAMTASPVVPITFAVGDTLSIVGPASPDATLAGVGFQIAATRAY